MTASRGSPKPVATAQSANGLPSTVSKPVVSVVVGPPARPRNPRLPSRLAAAAIAVGAREPAIFVHPAHARAAGPARRDRPVLVDDAAAAARARAAVAADARRLKTRSRRGRDGAAEQRAAEAAGRLILNRRRKHLDDARRAGRPAPSQVADARRAAVARLAAAAVPSADAARAAVGDAERAKA